MLTPIHQTNSTASPTPAHPPRVFGLAMLNSKLDDAEIVPFLDALKTAGYEGVCLHPRDGLRVPYGTPAYWKQIDHIFSLALERGLEIWHYDEFPFPSGMAGGNIPADDPTSLVRGLEFEEVDLSPNADDLIEVGSQALLAVLRYRVNQRGEKYDVRDITQDCGPYIDTWVWGEWHNKFYTGALHVHEELHERGVANRFVRAYQPETPLDANEKILAVKITTPGFRAGLPGRPDVTLPEVTDKFLEQIYARFSELSHNHGLQSTPVFQDEVTFGTAWPWNAEIEKRLRPIWGENFATKLAGLHAPDVEGWENARFEYRAACSDAFEQNWFKRVADFCHGNNLQMTGHLAGEESIVGHCQLLGDAFKNLARFDIPGFDIISSTLPDGRNRSSELGVKIVQCAAWMAGRKPTMVEVFGANGFHSDLQRQRNVLAWLGVHDLTNIFDHSAYHSSKSIRKYDAPPLSTRFNPLFAGRTDLWQWHNWFADLMQEYSFAPETLVLFPFESLARYSTPETEKWRDEVSLLETFFHYLFTASLDAVLLPSHRLQDVEARADGFHFEGQSFKNFVVPPFASLHENVWQRVLALTSAPGFAWCSASEKNQVTVFGETSRTQAIPAARVYNCTEAGLLQKQAAWFDELLDSPLRAIECDTTILKTRRRNAAGEALTIIINTQDFPVAVRVGDEPGEQVSQPHTGRNEYSGSDSGSEKIELAAREVLIYRAANSQEAGVLPAKPAEYSLNPVQSKLRFVAPNHLALKLGTTQLEGYPTREFSPAPVSSLWPLREVAYRGDDPVIAPPFSREKFPRPLAVSATFPLLLDEAITELKVLLDDESAPEQLEVRWDGVLLERREEDIYDQDNAVYSIPAKYLTIGAHQLTFIGVAARASQGILERPILIGKFLAEDLEARRTPQLRAMPVEAQAWDGESWPQLGVPQGFGPVEFQFDFEIPAAELSDKTQKWQLQLSPCIGVAEVFVNDELQGRSSWEPRVVGLDRSTLVAGTNRVHVRLHGSWNNVFSNLNRLENGLRRSPILRRL